MSIELSTSYFEELRRENHRWVITNDAVLSGYLELIGDEIGGKVKPVKVANVNGRFHTVSKRFASYLRNIKPVPGFAVVETGQILRGQLPMEREVMRGHFGYHLNRQTLRLFGLIHLSWRDRGRFHVEQLEHDLRQLYPESEPIHFQFYESGRIVRLK